MDEKKNNQPETFETMSKKQEKKIDEHQGDGPTVQMGNIPMRELVSTPLTAACEAQQQLAATALKYYEKNPFDETGQIRCCEFKMERPSQMPGETTMQEVTVKAPFIGLVPLPSLLIDNTDVDFQMEITDTSAGKSSDEEASKNAIGNWFNVNVRVEGKISTSSGNTHVTDQKEKNQIHVSANQQKTSEGLSKLMDIMANCIEPLESEE